VLGTISGSRYPVLAGLSPGEKVAAAGAFLIDAETRLNPAAGAAYFGGGGARTAPDDRSVRPAATASDTGANSH
jgi:Cu(I)/Ag(I) efflux system membrane fusion protein